MSIQTLKKVLMWVFLLSMVGLAAYVFVAASSGINNTVLFLIIALGVVAFIAWVVTGVIANNQRKAALQQMALERGLTYNQELPDLSSLLGGVHFEMTSVGRYQRVRSAMGGQWHGSAVKVFDLHYITGTGKNQSNHQQTGVVLALSDMNFPDFLLQPENVFNKIAAVLGQKDINFDEDSDFSKAFQLRGADEAALRQLFSPVVREWFKNHRGICAEMQISQLLLYRKEKLLQAEELLQLLDDCGTLVSQLRRYTR